jgi:hypothetical protein
MRTTVYLLLLSSLFLILTLVSGCDPEPGPRCELEPEAAPLVFAHDWTATTIDDDPLPDHRPALTSCPASSWGEELGVLEVSTGECNYLSVEQPLAEALAIGDPLRVQVWWQPLIASDPATAHLALLIDGQLIWEQHVAIPGAAQARSIQFESPISAEAGATVTFHLHNHGANSWTLAELARIDHDSACQ